MTHPTRLPRSKTATAVMTTASLLAVLLIVACGSETGDDSESATSSPGVEVEIGRVERGTVRAYIRTYGTVEAAPPSPGHAAAGAAVASQVEGVVAEVYCSEGQRVTRGGLLFLLDPRASDAAIAEAEVELEFAHKTLERQQSLMAVEGTSERALEEAEQEVASAETRLARARTERALLEVHAPLSGTVAAVRVRPGEAVGRDSVLAEMVDLDRLVVTLLVPVDQIAAVRVGQAAAIFTSSAAGEAAPTFSSQVSLKGTAADQRTGLVPVQVALPPASGLAPGTLVEVWVTTEERHERLLVPVESIVTLDDCTTIARVDDTTAVKVPVEVGLIDGDRAEISGEGVHERMTIVTVGAYGLPDRATIRVQPAPAAP